MIVHLEAEDGLGRGCIEIIQIIWSTVRIFKLSVSTIIEVKLNQRRAIRRFARSPSKTLAKSWGDEPTLAKKVVISLANSCPRFI